MPAQRMSADSERRRRIKAQAKSKSKPSAGRGSRARRGPARGHRAVSPRRDRAAEPVARGDLKRPPALSRGAGPGRRIRALAPRRPLPPRPRQALPAHGPARAGPGAPHHRDGNVPRNRHGILAGAGGSGVAPAGLGMAHKTGHHDNCFHGRFLRVGRRFRSLRSPSARLTAQAYP